MDRYQSVVNALKAVDLLIMAACFGLSAVLATPGAGVGTIGAFLELRVSVGNFLLFGAFAAFWHLLFSAFGLYGASPFWHGHQKAVDVLKATSIGTCGIVAAAVALDISFVDVRFMLVFWASVSLLSFCVRLVARELLVRHSRQEENLHGILLVGANTRALRLARRMESEREFACRVIGFIDDTADHAQNFASSGYELVAGFEELAGYLGRTAVDEVVICLPVKSRFEDISRVVSVCEEQGIAVGILGDLFEWNLAATSKVRHFGNQPIITVGPHGINAGRAAAKRAQDVVVSLLLLILLLPAFILTALAIKLSSPGPVIFSQERVGLNKKRFRMLKFRTMVANAMQQQAALEHFNEASGPVFKMKGDPRITPVGRFLRKSSLDEFPQLINVLKGEMSLVGPRPLPVRDYEGFSKDWHRRRVSVRPGITGLWQVNGRDHGAFDEWMKLDLEYIDRWSLMLDLRVMLLTIPAVLKGSGQ